MTHAPPLTIGLPVYNGERYLTEAIDSILGQTFGDFLLVVSDNASTDATGEIVRGYADRDERLQYSRSPENRGAVWNFNHVFAGCRSPLFKWAASDDVLAPTCVERCVETLRNAPPSVVLAYPRTRMIDADGNVLGDIEDGLDIRGTSPHKRLRQVVMRAVYGNVIFAVMRSDAVRRTHGHGAYPSSDRVLLAELALLGEFWEIPERLFLRRQHAGMSRRANQTVADLARWFDPESDWHDRELWRLLREHFRAVRRAPLSRTERALAEATLVSTWVRRHNGLDRLRERFTRRR
jgi:glycosyltransferase involved in cell wall biosynthesis